MSALQNFLASKLAAETLTIKLKDANGVVTGLSAAATPAALDNLLNFNTAETSFTLPAGQPTKTLVGWEVHGLNPSTPLIPGTLSTSVEIGANQTIRFAPGEFSATLTTQITTE